MRIQRLLERGTQRLRCFPGMGKVDQRFACGRDSRFLEAFLRTLRHHVECADRVHLVVKKFQPQRAECIRRIDIQNAAAQRELSLALDHFLAHIARLGKLGGKAGKLHAIPFAQRERVHGEQAVRHKPVHQRIDRRDDDTRLARHRAAQRFQTAAGQLLAAGYRMIKRYLSPGQERCGARRLCNILHHARAGLIARVHKEHLPSGSLAQRTGNVAFLAFAQSVHAHHAMRLHLVHELLKGNPSLERGKKK